MSDHTPPIVDLAAEGDVNLSPLRHAFEAEHVHAATRALLDADADAFLHQSLSTPCFNALASCDGIWLTDVEGRRIMDFHGNSVHQVGYRHPHVMAAVKAGARHAALLAATVSRTEPRSISRRSSPALRPIRSARSCSRRAARSRSAWR